MVSATLLTFNRIVQASNSTSGIVGIMLTTLYMHWSAAADCIVLRMQQPYVTFACFVCILFVSQLFTASLQQQFVCSGLLV